MNKILDKIKNVPIGVKAAAVYTLASVFSKGLAIITVPIFTRIMSTSEIGVVNLYNSWHSMLNAVVTLSLTSGGYSAALKEFGKERAISVIGIIINIFCCVNCCFDLYNMSVFLEWTDRSVNRFNGLDADWFFCSPSI